MKNNIPEVVAWIESPEGDEAVLIEALEIEITRYIKGIGFFFLVSGGWIWYYKPAPMALTSDEVSKYLDGQLDGQRRLTVRQVPRRLCEILDRRIA